MEAINCPENSSIGPFISNTSSTLTLEEDTTLILPLKNTSDLLCDFSAINALYEPLHGYIAIGVCILGTIFNMVNILVLTHQDMRTNPINLLLTGIAIADMLVMLDYIPFAIHMYLFQGSSRTMEEKFSYNWGVFLLFHGNFSIFVHTVSVWYTLVLAIWRLIMVKFHTMAVTYCTMSKCCALLIIGFVVSLFLSIPNYLTLSVKGTTSITSNGSNQTLYSITWSPLAESNDLLLYKLNVWFYSFFLKLVPCTLLSIITCLLIRALCQFSQLSASQDRPKYRSSMTLRMKQVNVRKMRTDRTTKLLIVILCLFLLSEFPQAILGFLSGLFGNQFFISCYIPLGELMDMLALINCMVNFILYCIMSRQFRITFNKIIGVWKHLFCLKNPFQGNIESPLDDLVIENYFLATRGSTIPEVEARGLEKSEGVFRMMNSIVQEVPTQSPG